MIYFLIIVAVVFAYLVFDLSMNPERYIEMKRKIFRKSAKDEKDEEKKGEQDISICKYMKLFKQL